MKYKDLIERIKALKEKIKNIMENNLSDEKAISDLDMLLNANSSTDYSLETLIDYLSNNDIIEDSFSKVIDAPEKFPGG